jgi:SAM-dependent methyltransferase
MYCTDMTLPKPTHLSTVNASAFQEESVVKAYQHRPVYPPSTFAMLVSLMRGQSNRVLDVGCGTGFIARNLATLVGQVDALDISKTMIDEAKNLPGGDRKNLNWSVAKAEDPLPNPPYALIIAGESLHWMDWEVVMPAFAAALEKDGFLTVLDSTLLPLPWDDRLLDFQALDLIAELEQRQLFQAVGRKMVEPYVFRQRLEDYIESFHGRASFSRNRMSAENADRFDKAILDLVEPYTGKEVELWVGAEIIWGKPLTISHRAGNQ